METKWTSNDEVYFENVLVHLNESHDEVIIFTDVSEVIVDVNKYSSGYYYEHATFRFDPTTKLCELYDVTTKVEVRYCYDFFTINKEEVNEELFHPLNLITEKRHWWSNKVDEKYSFTRGEFIYYRRKTARENKILFIKDNIIIIINRIKYE